MPKQLGRFIETFRGSSFPTRSETTEGESCVVKLRGAGNGAAALLSEFVVNRLAVRAGLPVPDVFIVQIEAERPWDYGTDEFYDLVQKSAGPNLALAWLDGVRPWSGNAYGSLPDELVSQVVTIDLAFSNVDRSAQSANLVEDAHQRRWIIDHGSCRFLFRPDAASARSASTWMLPADHIFAHRADAFDPRWLAPVNAALIAETTAEIPDAWLAEIRLTRDQVAKKITACLNTRGTE